MPLAGRLADLWGARRLFLGRARALHGRLARSPGMAQDLDQLIAARLVQAVGGGVLVPVGTAGAAHLFEGAGRPRALGVIGALTFLGMAAGPFAGGGHPVGRPPGGRRSSAAGLAESTPLAESSARPGAGSSTSTCPIALVRDRPRLGRLAGLGDAAARRAAWTSRAPRCSGSRWPPACSG